MFLNTLPDLFLIVNSAGLLPAIVIEFLSFNSTLRLLLVFTKFYTNVLLGSKVIGKFIVEPISYESVLSLRYTALTLVLSEILKLY